MIPRTTIDPGLITTAFDLPGHKVVRSLGVVRGIIVRSRSVFGTFGASIQTLFGGNITLFTQLCERARADAYSQMAAHAVELGANGIVGVRFDTTDVMSGVTEVFCYGTAVLVDRSA